MIVKGRGKNDKIEKLAALKRRLSPDKPQWERVKEELINRQSGERGERSIDYHLTFLPKDEFYILHDLRLENEQGYYFQIDTLLISSRFITIIDVKNYGGSILLDHNFNQLVQQYSNGDRRGLLDPISQIRRQVLQLKTWMKRHGMKNIPVESLIVISNSSTIIETTSDPSHYGQVTRSINIDSRIEAFRQKYQKKSFTKKEIWALIHVLKKVHSPGNYDPLNHFKITSNEILNGVHCTNCSALPMIRVHGSWKCPGCMHRSKSAHNRALKDYQLLIKDTITIREMCDFLCLPSRYSAYRLIQAMDLCNSGGTKGRKYHLEFE